MGQTVALAADPIEVSYSRFQSRQALLLAQDLHHLENTRAFHGPGQGQSEQRQYRSEPDLPFFEVALHQGLQLLAMERLYGLQALAARAM